MLEPYEGKLSRTVLRGVRGRDAPRLPDEWPGSFDKVMNRRAAEFIFSGMFCYGIISFSYIMAKMDKEKSAQEAEKPSDLAKETIPDSLRSSLENQLKIVTEDRDRLQEKVKNLEVSLALANELIKHNLIGSPEGKGTDKTKKGENQVREKSKSQMGIFES